MKLRTRSDSIRLRLVRTEVARLRETGRVDEVLEVTPGARLGWSLAVRDDLAAPRALLEGGVLVVEVPRAIARDWWETERVGFDAVQKVGERELRILVEKDWVCLTGREHAEDETDAYPHPHAHSGKC